MRKYLRQTVDSCREKGYVQTMLGRKRYLQSITGTNPHARSQAERQAVNTTVQGSAADLVKMAMIEIDSKLMEKFPNCQATHKQKLHGNYIFLALTFSTHWAYSAENKLVIFFLFFPENMI